MAFKAVLLLACTAGALAGPLNYQYSSQGSSTECARTCPDTGKFEYVPGKTYEYQYEADIKTHIPGTTEEHSSLHLRANVQIEVITKCELALRMSDVTLQDSDPSDYRRRQSLDGASEWARSVQERPLRFAFLDGTIDAVCPDEREMTWVLNVKRGVLSALQNTMVSLDGDTRRRETDVSGECDVDYKVGRQTWSSEAITKTKDVLSCTGHQHLHSIIQSTPYRVASKLQSLPLLKSTQECTQEVSKNVIGKSICKETHTFRPFSRGPNGASTEVEQTLTFSKESRGTRTRQETITMRKSLVFEHVDSVEELENSRREAQNTLRELCRETTQDIRPSTPALFSQLVRSLKKLDAETLANIHRGSSGICAKAHDFVHDALPTLGTTSAVRVMKNLVLSGDAGDTETDIWFTSMSFISDPIKEMLSEVKPILESDHANRKAVLAISALVHSYCRVNENCGQLQEVRDIIKVFEDNLRYNCKTTTEDLHEKMMSSLKAIGNTGHAESVAPTLVRCFQDAENPMHVRIAAVNAFRRMACHATTELETLLRDTMADSELRINAYLSMMECPTENTLNVVRGILETEEVNQVGSFIWTHLTNLMETSSPLKQETRMILEQVTLEKKFNLDQRKFSRNIELSGFSTMMNAGGSAESNVIWSSKSWLPRSASLDLTIDMFGQSINLMEMGGRVEGADKVLESLFANKDVNDVLSRQKRDTINARSFGSFDSFKPGFEDDPKMSYYLRIFGNEVRFEDFHGFDLDTVKEKFNYLQWLIELAKEHEIDATKSIQFLDSSLVVPTIVGLPLKLSVDGTAVMDIKIRGKLDLRNLAAAELDIDGSIRPSAAVEITGEMGVDAWIAKTGLKMVSTLHTSNIADGKIQLQNGQMFNIDVNMPNDRVELFDYKSQFFVVHRENSRQQRMSSEGRTEKDYCIDGVLKSALGIKLCGEMGFPSLRPKDGEPWFPFNGPVTAKMFVQKEDTHTGYHMEAKLIAGRRGQDNDELKLSFNTPGSKVDRELMFDYLLNRRESSLTIGMKSPWKKADFTGTVTDDADKKQVTARAVLDDRHEYSFTTELAIQKTKVATRYTPLVELSVPGKQPYRLTGNVLYRPGKKVDVDISAINIFDDPVTITGDVNYVKKQSRWQSSLALNSAVVMAAVEGFVQNVDKKDLISSRLELEYTLDPKQRRAKQERFTISNKLRYNNKNYQYSLDSAMTSTKWPQWNMDGNFELAKSQNKWESSIDAGLTDSNKRIKWTQSLTNTSNRNKVAFDFTARFRCPIKKMDYEVAIDHQHTNQMVKHSSNVKYGRNQQGVFNMDAEIESTEPLKAHITTGLTYPGGNWAFMETLEEKRPKEYHQNMDIKADQYEDIKIKSVYKQMETGHDVKADITTKNYRPIKLEGFLNPNLKNFQGRAEATVGRDSYGVDSSLFFNGRPVAFSTRSALEVTYPGRTVKMDGEFTRRQSNVNGRLDVQWDVNRDPNKKVAVSGEVDMNPRQPSFQVKTQWYPTNMVEVSGTFKNDRKGWYDVERDLEGSLKAVTSFRGFENMDFMFSHDQARDECKTHSELSWGRAQKIEYDFELKKPNGWSELQTKLTVKTPFDELRTGGGEMNYNLRRNELKAEAKFDYNRQVVAVNFDGKANLRNHMIDGKVTINTPFNNYEEITASVKHQDDGRTFSSEVSGRLNPRQNFDAKFNMNHQRQNWAVTNNGQFTFNCPGERIKLNWDHKNDANTFQSKHTLEYNGQKHEVEIDANLKENARKWEVDLKSKLTCPHSDGMMLNFNHEHDPRNYKNMKTSGNFQWKRNKNIAFENEMSYVPRRYITKSTKITTPFSGYEEITSTVNTRFNGGEVTTTNEIRWGNNRISSEKTFNLIDAEKVQFDYNWKLTTTFAPVKRANIRIRNIETNGVYKTDVEGRLNSDKAEISSEVDLRNPMKVKLDVKTPWAYMRTLEAQWDYQGNPRDFTTKGSVNHNMLDGPIMAELQLDTAQVENIKGEFSLDTPYRAAKKFKVMLGHKRQGNTYTTDASFQMPRQKVTVSNEFMARALTNWNSKTEIEYNRQKMTNNMEFVMNHQGTRGDFSLETPFENAEIYRVSFNHKGGPTDFSTKADVTYAPSKTITTEVMFKNVRDRVEGSLEIATPFDQLQKGSFSFNHEGDRSNAKQSFNADVNGRRFSGTHEWTYNGRDLTCTTTLKTPYQGWRNNELRIKHEGEAMDFKNDIAFEYDNNAITSHIEYEYDDTGVKGKFEFTSPFPFVRDIKLELDHSGNMRAFRNQGTVEYNGRRYSGNTRYGRNNRGYSAAAAVTVPEEYGIEFEHDGDLQDMSSKVEFTMDRKKTNLEALYKNDGSNLESSLSMRSPYRGYERAKVSVNHKNTGSGFVTSGDMESSYPGYDKMNFEISQDRRGREMKSSGFVRTPFKILPVANFDVSHTGDKDDFTSTGSLELDEEKYSGNVNYKNDGSMIEAGFGVQTPYERYEEQGMMVMYKNTRRGFKSSATLDTSYPGFKKFGTEVTHKGDWENFESRISLDTPFRRVKRSVMSVAHSGAPEDFSTTIKTEVNGNKMEGTLNLKKIGGWFETDHEAMISLSTPYEAFRDFEMKSEHKDQGRQCVGKIEVSHNGEKQLDADYTRRTGRSRSIEVNMRKPRPASVSGTMDSNGEITGEASVNWDPQSRNRNARFEYGLKNNAGDRRIKFKTILPNRIVGIDTGYTCQDDSFTHDMTLQWDKDDSSKVSYTTEGSSSERRRQKMVDWKLEATTPYGPFKTTVSNQQVSNRVVTEVSIEGSDKLTVKNEFYMKKPNFEDFAITTTVKHPRMRRDAVLKVEGMMQERPFKWDGNVNLQYSTQNFVFSGKLADESVGRNSKYIAEAKATHPSSFLDFEFKSEALNTRETVGGNMQIKYQTTTDRQVKTMALKTQLNKLRDELSLELQSPVNRDVRLTGRRLLKDYENGIHKFTLNGEVAGSDVSGELEVDTSSPGAELKFNYKPDEMVHIYGRYLTPSHMQMEVNHESRGRKTQDAHFSLQLDADGMLGTRAFLRKEIKDDLQRLFRRNDALSRKVGKVKEDIQREFGLKMQYLGQAGDPLQSAWMYTTDAVSSKYGMMTRDFKNAYKRNEFYMKDICEAGQELCNDMSEKMEMYKNQLRRKYGRQWEQMKRDWSSEYERMTRQMRYDMNESWKKFSRWANEVAEEAGQNFVNFVQTMRQQYESNKQSLYRAAQNVSPQGIIRNYERIMDSLQTKYRNFMNTDFAKMIREHLETCRANLERRFEEFKRDNKWLVDEYWRWYYKGNDMYKKIMSYPEAQQAKTAVTEIVKTSKWWYDYMEFEKRAEELYNTMKNTDLETLKEQAKMYLQEKLQWDRNRIIVWDPEKIEFQAEMYVPVEIRDLQSLPRPNIQRQIARVRNWINNYMPDDDYQFYDTLYKYKPSPDPYNWVPPFKSHATIAGSQHYMTFDKRFYEFSGECSYVLARDFIDGNFTVVANYDNVGGAMTKKSLTVMMDDKQVEIFPNFKVLLDGRRSETPIQFGSTVVRRVGNMVRVDSEHGVTVICDLPHDRCTVNVTGWYYGKTGGLFGTYDNEPRTDFTKADNTLATSPEELASSWAVGRRCSVRNYAAQGSETVDRVRICGKYFREESSPFRICFKQVDNEAFMRMCLNDLPTNVNHLATEEDTCNVASFYVAECERAGVPLRMPTTCVKCMTEDGRTFREGDNMTLSGSTVPKSADVVFVASQRACNRDVINSLGKIVTQVDKALKAEDMTGNRYSLVGFAAEGWFASPHIHTMQNEIFNDRTKFDQALQNFHIIERTDAEDPITAIQFATRLPFRTGVSKTIVLIPCGECQERATSYLDVQQLLLNRDIRLHVLQQQDFALKKNTPTSSYIFGVDKDAVYTQKHVGARKLMGDRGLRKQVSMPKDLCVALTQESDGSVFNARKLTGRAAAQKKFIDVLTRLLAKKATPTECQKCDCMVDQTGVGMSVCRSCNAGNAFYDLFPRFETDSESSDDDDNRGKMRKPYNKPKKPKDKRRRRPN